jgi:dCMP deaminase
MRTLVAYVPVLHEGYRRFFEKYDGPKELYIFGPEITADYKQLGKEIRQLDPELMKKAVEALGIFTSVSILDIAGARALNSKEHDVVLPDEDVSRELHEKYFPSAKVVFDPIFLRWDRKNAKQEKEVQPEERITHDEFHRRVMAQAEEESKKSSDIWRHVGGAIVKDKKVILLARNRHLPSDHSPYANGDPRGNWSQGVEMELASGFHCEVSLIAEAAKRGVALRGAGMYVTVFPCPPCSKAIACSGIKNLYVGGGKGILDSEDVLKNSGVKIIFVE